MLVFNIVHSFRIQWSANTIEYRLVTSSTKYLADNTKYIKVIQNVLV